MKSTVFVRPNIKMFLFGAILVVAVQHLINAGRSQAQALSKPIPVNGQEITDRDVEKLIAISKETPTADILLRISQCYEKKGDYKKALFYLRRAEKAGQSEEASD